MILTPDWPAPPAVHAAFTLRTGGVSEPPCDTLNLGTGSGDAEQAVAENRRRVQALVGWPSEPVWLEQVHGTTVIDLDRIAAAPQGTMHRPPRADGAVSRRGGRVCVVRVADCMPVLFAARDGSVVGAAHAGWRGMAGGVLDATVQRLGVAPRDLLAWMGPAIGPAHFEVGEEVRTAFMEGDAGASVAFAPNPRGRWQCDLYALARRKLLALGIGGIHGGGWCTYADAARFFSYRRDGRCGRMAALIWAD
ncbi:MAG TPA: peptidoglycan editing factor PgeF [Steroidobacteraceae bacterium]|nr:peptidoglycan editing factor PgeF [Steroidobacteraceae bacterium]